MTVLNGGGHSIGSMHQQRTGFDGEWTADPTKLSNDYFKTLLSEQWEAYTVPTTGKMQYKANGKALFMLPTDLLFKIDAELAAIAQEYASDNTLFLNEFAAAWTK